MNIKLSQSRVKGYLKAKDKILVNEDGEEIILAGWGLGNWLLQEGYMWLNHHSRFDRPRRIEQVIRECAGTEYSTYFWGKFRDYYVTKADIKLMAELGYNSVRIPFNWRLFMEDEPGIKFKEEGFNRIDHCLDWCEEYKIYAFLDMHGAPGGQTGANIDDSIDDVPRLFIDQDSWEKALKLWQKIANRYKDRWIVGGYDLLNEPIRPKNGSGDYDYLLPKLSQFYEEAVAIIRKVDKNHLLTIEGHHWATSPQLFTKRFDENMVIHFHRYACMPDRCAFKEWMDLSQKWNVPLWMGETGENLLEWFTAFYPLSISLGIGFNLWPWKKMNATNSPLSIKKPDGWDEILDYIKGGPRPTYARTHTILNQYLENLQVINCTSNLNVTNHVFRKPPCTVRGTDFDVALEFGKSYSGSTLKEKNWGYRDDTMMTLVEEEEKKEKRFSFDCQWDRFLLKLSTDEFVSYSIFETTERNTIAFDFQGDEVGECDIYQNEQLLETISICPQNKRSKKIPLNPLSESIIKVHVKKGQILIERVHFE